MSPTINFLLTLTIILVVLPHAHAFGAGDIPDFAYLNEKAFRHGDIENILESLVKYSGHAASGGGLLGFASHVIKKASGGSKFDKGDIKKVYFGNWLRDYSQCMDIAGLSKLTADTLVLVVSVLGFMTFGFATEEFEVTAERLGVYLCVEHIDNPKGYAEKEGDARQFHPKLRPPVDPRELEVDQRTGMKNYMATEDGGWDTSTAHIRRVLTQCIELGRRSEGQEGPELFEAYRLLGTGLHTLEDLLAHSNWCEIALRKMGHQEVFCHVGDNVNVEAPSGDRVPPLVTGTFGSADFLHSLLGEATDHLSQASVTALSDNLNQSKDNDTSEKLSALKDIIGKFGGGDDDKISKGEELQQKSQAYDFNPDDVAPKEVQQQLLDLLKWRDDLYRDIIKKIEMVPGLSDLVDEMSNALNAYVYTVIAPWLTPILTQATSVLGEGSKAVIDTDDQYTVFDDDNASDPSHSLLSKDHFGLILNEPAGKIAQVVVVHSVQLIVRAWSKDMDPNEVVDAILEAFHHPYYASGRSEIQQQMFDEMEKWIGGLGEEASGILEQLTKQSVRDGKNKREGEGEEEAGYGGCGHGGGSASYAKKQSQSSYGGAQAEQQSYGGNDGGARQQSYESSQQSYGGNEDDRQQSGRRFEGQESSYGDREDSSYGRNENSYGQSENSYGQNDNSYSQSDNSYGRGGGGQDYSRNNNDGDQSYQSSGRRFEGHETEAREEYSTYEGGARDQSSGRGGYGGGGEGREEYQGGDSYESTGYAADEGGRGGYQGGGNYQEPSRESSYGRNDREESYGREQSSYGEREGASYGGEEERYGGHHGRRHEEDSAPTDFEGGGGGYNPGYGRGEGNEETFGAERMNIRDDNGGGYGRENDNGGGYGGETEGYGRRNEYDSGY